MAVGLLDFLNSDDAALGLGLLAAGGPTTDPNQAGFGARMAGAVGQARHQRNANEDRTMRRGLLQSQIDENASQAEARRALAERQRRMDDYFLGGGGGTPVATAPSTPGAPSVIPGAALGAGPGTPPPPQGKFAEWSKQFGIPLQALDTDYRLNGGKGIAEMLMKRGTPDMQVTGGYAYDKNRVQPGFLPNVSTSANGQTTVVDVDPRTGQPYAYAAPGSVAAAQQFARAKETENARFRDGPSTIGADGRTHYQSALEAFGGGATAPPALPGGPLGTPRSGGPNPAAPLGVRNNNPGNLRPVGANTGFQQFETPEAGLAALDQNLQSYGKRGINTIEGVVSRWAPPSENNTKAYVASVSQRLGVPADQPIDLASPYVRQALTTAIMLQENGTKILTGAGAPKADRAPMIGPGAGAPMGGRVTKLSPAEEAANESRKQFATNTAKADADRLETWRGAAESGNSMIQTAQRLRSITASGIYEGGGAQAKTAVASMVAGLTGIKPAALPGSEQFNAEASNLILGQIKSLGANPSNADREFILKTIPQITNSPQARNALLQFMEQKGQRSVELYRRADSYARSHGGLGGFDQFERPAASAPSPSGLPAGWSVKVK